MQKDEGPASEPTNELTRRELLERAAAAGLVLALPPVFGASGAGAARDFLGKPGGRFRFALSYDSPTGTFDPAREVIDADGCRRTNTFDTVMALTKDHRAQLRLASLVEPNKTGTVWTVRLRHGVTFHNGKDCTADDLIYSIRRILNPQTASGRRTFLAAVDPKRLRKRDKLTVEIALTRPNSDMPLALALTEVVQNGATYKSFKTHPIGTGPFMFVSWTPGRETLWKRNPNYWHAGQPKVDELELVVIQDNGARINALLSGQVNAIERIDPARVKELQRNPAVRVLIRRVNAMVPITMRLDRKPFTDARVRQAMRLIADRKQMVQSAFNGYATVANDLYGRGQPFYNNELPQREQDLDRAKSLLKKAGAKGLTFKLSTSDAVPGMSESATVFAEQAKKAGIKVILDKIPSDSYFGTRYPYSFGQSAWADNPLNQFYELGLLINSPFPETKWRKPSWDKHFRDAQATLNQHKKKQIYFDLQEVLWNQGGYLQWSDSQYLDAVQKSVRGISTHPQYPLGSYDFRTVTVR
jgi:peptide/nickel transport system substrate-binding protein